MESLLTGVRETRNNNALGVIRVVAGIMILGSGVMKYGVAHLWEAWSGQLIAAELPFYTLTLWAVPTIEIVAGGGLLLGFFARLCGAIIVVMMAVATYVHIVADNPDLFPLQPHQPVVPLMLLAMSAFVVLRGGGAWSLDLRSSRSG